VQFILVSNAELGEYLIGIEANIKCPTDYWKEDKVSKLWIRQLNLGSGEGTNSNVFFYTLILSMSGHQEVQSNTNVRCLHTLCEMLSR
jgi:hypothetical protein